MSSVAVCSEPAGASAALRSRRADLVILDQTRSEMSLSAAVDTLRGVDPGLAIVVGHAAPGRGLLLEAFRVGVVDFLTLPVTNADLLRALRRAAEVRHESRRALTPAAEDDMAVDILSAPPEGCTHGTSALPSGYQQLDIPLAVIAQDGSLVGGNAAACRDLAFLFGADYRPTGQGASLPTPKALIEGPEDEPLARVLVVRNLDGTSRRYMVHRSRRTLDGNFVIGAADISDASETANRLLRLVHRYQRALSDIGFLNRWLSEINAHDDPIAMLDELCDQAADLAGVDTMAVYELQEDGGYRLLAESFRDEGLPAPSEIRAAELPADFRPRRPLLITRFEALPDSVRAVLAACDTRSLLVRSLSGEGANFGLVAFTNRRSLYFGRRRRSLLDLMANAVTVAIRRHLLVSTLSRVDEERRTKQAMLDRAERLGALGGLASAIGHEISQPLQSIKVVAESALLWAGREDRKPSYASLLESLARVADRARWAAQIIADMKAIIRTPEQVDIHPVDVAETILLSLEDNTERLAGISVEVKPASDVCTVAANSGQLRQVLNNLIRNAAEAALAGNGEKGPKPWIGVEVRRHGSDVSIAVLDNGDGIADEVKPRVFDPLFRGRKKSGGQGLGLFVVHTMVKAMGGTVVVLDNEPRGARFVITIPCGEPA